MRATRKWFERPQYRGKRVSGLGYRDGTPETTAPADKGIDCSIERQFQIARPGCYGRETVLEQSAHYGTKNGLKMPDASLARMRA